MAENLGCHGMASKSEDTVGLCHRVAGVLVRHKEVSAKEETGRQRTTQNNQPGLIKEVVVIGSETNGNVGIGNGGVSRLLQGV